MANPLVLLILSATIGIIIGPPAATDDQTRGKWTACSQTIGRPTCSDWASRMDLNWGKGLDPTHHHQTSATIGEGWTCRAQPIETIDIPPAVSEGWPWHQTSDQHQKTPGQQQCGTSHGEGEH